MRIRNGLRTGLALAAFATLGAQLAGCVPLVVGAVGVGVYGVTDRRSYGAQADDKVIAVRVDSRIGDALSDRAHVNVNSFNRKVLLTGKVKAELLTKKVPPNTVSVVTEKRIVYLMGRVTQDEGNTAAEAARGVHDVAKVVKVFDYIAPDELEQIKKTGAT